MKFYYPPVVRTFEGLRGLGADTDLTSFPFASRAALGQYVVDKLQDPANLKDRKSYFTNALVRSWSARRFNLPSLASLSRGASYASKEAVLAAARNYLSQSEIDKALAQAKSNRQDDATIVLGFGGDVRDAISSATPTEAAAAIKALVFKTQWGGFTADKIQDSAMIVLRSVSSRVGGDTMERFLTDAFGFAGPTGKREAQLKPATQLSPAAYVQKPSATVPALPTGVPGDMMSTSWQSGPAAPTAPPAGKQGQASLGPAPVKAGLLAEVDAARAAFDDALVRYTQEGTASAGAAVDAAEKAYSALLLDLRAEYRRRYEYFAAKKVRGSAIGEQFNIDKVEAELARIKQRPQVSKKPAGSAAPQTTDKERQEAAGGSSYTPPPPGSGMPSSPPPSSVVGPSYSAPAAAEPTSGGIDIPGLVTPQQQYAQQQAAKKGLSTGAWVGIGLGAAALLGVGIWAATRKR